MFVSPSKLKKNKILMNRTVTFETVQPAKGNMIFILADNKTTIANTINSKLFRPMQAMCLYTPRRVHPTGKSQVIIDQKEYYSEIRDLSDGRIKKCKTQLNAYMGQNVIYDIYNDYTVNSAIISKRRRSGGIPLQTDLRRYMEQEIASASDNSDYQKFYVVFPMDKYLDKIKRLVETDLKVTDMMVLFLKSIVKGTIDKDAFKNIDLFIFYNKEANAMVVLDLKDPEFDKNFPGTLLKIYRLNNFNNGEELPAEDVDYPDTEELTPEDKLENDKEVIKTAVLSNVAKKIKANNLTDFEAASRDEQELISAIDKKIEKYIVDNKDSSKTFSDLEKDVEEDQDVKMKAIRYVETKKAGMQKLNTLAKGLERETEVIGSIQDLEEDSETDNTPAEYKINKDFIDPRIEKSALGSMDEEYNKKQNMKDLTNVVSSLSSSETFPATVESFELKDSSTYQDYKKTLSVKYRTADNKQLSFQIDIPDIIDKRYFYLGGNKKVIKKQLFRLPVVKTKPDRVEITTNFNKMTIERSSGKLSRHNEYLLKYLKGFQNNPNVQIIYGSNSAVNNKRIYSNDFEYEELADSISTIFTVKYKLYFNRENMDDEMAVLDIPEDFIGNDKTPLGIEYAGETPKKLVYIAGGKVYSYELDNHIIKEISPSMYDFICNDVLKIDTTNLPNIGKSFVYTTVKFLATSYPMLAVVASQNGLTDILRRYGVVYYFSKEHRKSPDYVSVKFKDKYLNYKDEMKNSLLLNAIYMFNTENYNYDEFDSEQPYADFFKKSLGETVGIYTRNTLRINLGAVIDPITRDVLHDLKLPTNIIDVLLYANTLLVGNQYTPQNDLKNYRVRSNEVVNAVLYKIIADAFVNYQKHKMNGRPINLVINSGALIKELLAQPNVNDFSSLNPVLECEEIAKTSAKGFRGVNINDAFTLEMRAYDDSMEGIVSGNATPYSGQAGITRSLSYDPKISSVRGYIPALDKKTLDATNILSPTELLSTFTSAQADPPRQAMQVAQTGHTMMIAEPSKQLVGSGMNKTLAYMISDDFAFKAKEDGVVTKIDNKNNLALLTYNSGNKDAIDLSDKFAKNSNMGFYIHQKFLIVYAEGEHFKKGDVIAYNPAYFTGKGKDVDYQPGALAKIAIAPGDFSFEDATIINESLAKKCTSKINMLKQIVLGKNATIYSLANIGDKVKAGDTILDFTSSFADVNTSEFLAKLSAQLGDDMMDDITHEEVHTKYSGTITDIKIFYNCPFEELSQSIQDIIKKYKNRITQRQNALGNIRADNVHIPPLEQVAADKIGKAEFPEDGGVIINVLVEYADELGAGDKITFNTALKGVVSKVLSEDESPVSEYRPEAPIEAVLTPTGIISRMTVDIYSMTYSNKILIELGKQIREIWNGER